METLGRVGQGASCPGKTTSFIAHSSSVKFLITLFIWSLIASLACLSCVLAFPAWLLVPTRWDPQGRRFSWIGHHVWGLLPFRLNPFWRLRLEGLEHLKDLSSPLLLLPNHQSMVDVLAILALPLPLKWITHSRFFQVPALGYFMGKAGYIGVDTRDLSSARAMIRRAIALLEGGSHVALFPEGTRSGDGEVGTFLMGPFRIALDSGATLVPVAIDGTREALPKGGWLPLGKGPWTVRVRLLTPIPAAEYQGMGAAPLARLVEARVKGGLASLREKNRVPHGSPVPQEAAASSPRPSPPRGSPKTPPEPLQMG